MKKVKYDFKAHALLAINVNPYVELARPWQWYKNLIAFLAIFFSGKLFVLEDFFHALLAFFSLSLTSSAVYVINDVIDVDMDKRHPRKRNRPIPSGRVSIGSALAFAAILFALGLFLAVSLNMLVLLFNVALAFNALFYSLIVKRMPYLDVSVLSLNFLFRTLAGVFAIGEYPSYWIVVIPYFVALFLALLKRYGELQVSKESRESLSGYDIDTLKHLAAGALFTILILYTLYISFHTNHRTIITITTIPIAVFTLFRWFSRALSDPEVAEEAAKMVYDRYFIAGMILWVTALLVGIYL